MGGRIRSIKIKILFLLVVPLVALITLWGFAVAVTLGDSVRLLRANTYEDKVVRPTEALVTELQNERRMSLAFIGGDAARGREGFDAQRAHTDDMVIRFRRAAAGGDLEGAATAETRRRMADLVTRLNSLGGLRTSVDRRAATAPQAFAQFNTFVDVAESIYDPVSPGTPELAKEAMTLIALSQAREVVSREDALLTGALSAGRFSTTDHQQFIQLMAAHRAIYTRAVQGLPEADQARYRQLVAGPNYGRFVGLEDRLAAATGTERRPPVDLGSWHTASEAVLAQLADIETATRSGTTQRAHDHASSVIIRLILAGGLGLIAVLASAVLAVRIGSRLIRESRALAADMHTFARDKLPVIAELARRGEVPDEDLGMPARTFTVTEIDQVYAAFVAARQAVVTATVNESRTRRGLSEVFVNLARRSQALLHRQLTLLDGMERRAEGSAELQDLFQLDHLATRMRRHAEGLVILSGRPAGRTWRTPVPMIDVVRGAASEVEDYARVRVLPMSSAALAGPAVADTVHLLAELIENAMMFSPPASPVQVTGQIAAKGFVVEIEDRGLGMSPETLAEANQRLQDAPDFDPSDSARMGLFVVARLARRQDIKVTLRNSPYGGTAAIVLIPAALVMDPDRPAVESAAPSGAAANGANGRVEPIPPLAARALPAAAADAADADAMDAAYAAAVDAADGPDADGRVSFEAAGAARHGNDEEGEEGEEGEEEASGDPAAGYGDRAGEPGGEDDLPRRRRQANLAPRLRRDPADPADPAATATAATAAPGERSPEAASTMIAAMQRGWQRGRAEAGEQAGDLSRTLSDGEEQW